MDELSILNRQGKLVDPVRKGKIKRKFNKSRLTFPFIDWMMTLVVIDDSFEGRADLSTQNPAGLSVNIFKKNPNEFPAVKQVGDIVQFRHFKVILPSL